MAPGLQLSYAAMRLVTCVVAVLAISGCALSAQRTGARAAVGAATEIEERARALKYDAPVAERMARGAMLGLLSELEHPRQREELLGLLRATSTEITAAIIAELQRPENLARWERSIQLTSAAIAATVLDELRRPGSLAQLEQTIQLTSASAMRGVMEGPGQPLVLLAAEQATRGVTHALSAELSAGAPLSDALSTTVARVSGSAARAFRDEVDVFPACRGPERTACVQQQLAAMSRAAAFGFGDGLLNVIKLPLLVASFLLGAALALVLAGLWSRRRRGHGRARLTQPAHAR